MTRFTRAAWIQAQTIVVIVLCLGATLVLPLSLAAIGFQTA